VHNSTQAPNLVKDSGSTLDLNPQLERTLPSFGNISLDIYRVHRKNPIIKADI
jgi:hypothetical protein